MAYGFKTLEKKYGIKVISEGQWWHPLRGRYIETFKIFTGDGCCWEKGLSRKGVKAECEEWHDSLMRIKANCERVRKEN